MRKDVVLFFLSVLLFGFSLNDYQKVPKTLYNLRQIVSSYPEGRILDNLRGFVSCCQKGRLVGTASHQKSLSYIKKILEEYDGERIELLEQEFDPDIDYAVELQQKKLDEMLSNGVKREDENFKKVAFFTQQKTGRLQELKQTRGKNLIWEKKGAQKPNDVLILLAHYDNIVYKDSEQGQVIAVESQMPGADKNASGVALLLSMAEVLEQVELPKTVRLVFLDFGEFENLGAKAYVDYLQENHSQENLKGAINVMMVGHSSKTNHQKKIEHDMRLYYPSEAKNESSHQDLAKFIKELGDQMGTPMKTELEVWERTSGAQKYFWDAGLASLLYSHNWEEDANPRIHSSNDFVETLNFKTLHGNLRYLTGAALAWAFDLE